ATPVDQHRRHVATFPDNTLHAFRVLPKADQEDLEALPPKLAIEFIDGRQLLPAIGSPRRPEEEKDQLAAQRLQADRLAREIGQREDRRDLWRLIGLRLERGEVWPRGAGAGRRQERDGQGGTRDSPPHAPTCLRAASTSSGWRRSSGLSRIFIHL